MHRFGTLLGYVHDAYDCWGWCEHAMELSNFAHRHWDRPATSLHHQEIYLPFTIEIGF
jgi:hypothetical protein